MYVFVFAHFANNSANESSPLSATAKYYTYLRLHLSNQIPKSEQCFRNLDIKDLPIHNEMRLFTVTSKNPYVFGERQSPANYYSEASSFIYVTISIVDLITSLISPSFSKKAPRTQ